MAEDQLYTTAVVDTRPRLEVDGALHDMIDARIESLEVTEQEGGLSSLEALLGNDARHEAAGIDFAFEYSETNLLPLGAALRVLTGDFADPQEIFAGTITSVAFEMVDGGQPKLRVMAEDELMALRMVRRNRTFAAAPLRDIVKQVVADTPLAPVITGLNDRLDAQQQLNETDLGFLRRILARHDADIQAVGKELHVSPRAAVDRGKVTLALGRQLRSVRVTADLAHQRAATCLSGFDVASGKVVTVGGKLDQLGPGAGLDGAAAAGDLFPGSRDRLCDTAFRDQTEAQALADAAHRRRTRRFVVAEGTATGNSAIRVGTVLALTDLGPRFSNDFYTVSARHSFDVERGYMTDFTAECPCLGRI